VIGHSDRVAPPPISMIDPWMKSAFGDTRQATGAAPSSGRPAGAGGAGQNQQEGHGLGAGAAPMRHALDIPG